MLLLVYELRYTVFLIFSKMMLEHQYFDAHPKFHDAQLLIDLRNVI